MHTETCFVTNFATKHLSAYKYNYLVKDKNYFNIFYKPFEITLTKQIVRGPKKKKLFNISYAI